MMKEMTLVFGSNAGEEIALHVDSHGKVTVMAGFMGHDQAKALAERLPSLVSLVNASFRPGSGCHVDVGHVRGLVNDK